jgi:hypothetical protein
MSRYLEFKKNYEEIIGRAVTPSERELLQALVLIRKAYDINYADMRKAQINAKRKHGGQFVTKMRNCAESKKQKFLWKLPLEERKEAQTFFDLDYMEKQLYYISKTIRKGIGLELTDEQLEASDEKYIERGKDFRREIVSSCRHKELAKHRGEV